MTLFTNISLLLKTLILIIVIFETIDADKIRVKLMKPANLSCHLSGYHLTNYTWIKINDTKNNERLKDLLKDEKIEKNHVTMILKFNNVTRNDDGTYECRANIGNVSITNRSELVIIEIAKIEKFDAKFVMVDKIFVKWKINNGNDPITKYIFLYKVDGTEQPIFLDEITNGNLSNAVLDTKELKKDIVYKFGIEAVNSVGHTPTFWISNGVKMIKKDREFVPNFIITNKTERSITVNISSPTDDLRSIQSLFWEVKAVEGNTIKLTERVDINITFYTMNNLKPETNYKIMISLRDADTGNAIGSIGEQNVQTLREIVSSGSHHAEINSVTVYIIVSIYFLMKYLIA